MSSDGDNPFFDDFSEPVKPVAECYKCGGDVFYDYSAELYEKPLEYALLACWHCGQQYKLIDGKINE